MSHSRQHDLSGSEVSNSECCSNEFSNPIPTVTIVMTTYNGYPLIIQSIDSILAQTWRDFELLVVDDCSTDGTVACLERYVDPRLRIVRTPRNLGVVGSRNLGFSFARGRYLATLDHDDISMPDRLARQVSYLDAHPDVVLVGSKWLNLTHGVTLPDPYAATEPFLVRWALYLSNPICYSSIMVRMDCIRRLSPPMRQERILADDFDLYHRLLTFGEIARLPEALIIYRLHSNNTFRHRMQEMQANAVLVLTEAYSHWFGPQSRDVAEVMTRLVSSREVARDDEELCRLRDYLNTLATLFIEEKMLPHDRVQEIRSSVKELWGLALQRRLRAGGFSSLRHMGTAWKEGGTRWIDLLKAIISGLLPARTTIGKSLRLMRSRLPEKLGPSWHMGNNQNEISLGWSSPTLEWIATAIVILLCSPLLIVIWAQALGSRLSRSARERKKQ